MSARLLAGPLAVGLVGLVAGALLPGVVAVVLTAAAAGAAAVILAAADRRRLRRAIVEVEVWRAGSDSSNPGGSPPTWRQLAGATEALGRAYQRRGEKLGRQRPWRRELVDSLVNAAVLFTDQGRLRVANNAARELFGIPPLATDLTVMQSVGSPALVSAIREVRRSGEPATVDTSHGDRELRSVVSRVADETLVIATDRTRERQVEKLRRNFVVNASHELKTPVTSIQTLSEALAVTIERDPARSASLVARLGDEASRLANLVQDLLDLRRLEESSPAERVPVDLAELVRRCVTEQLDHARSLEIDIEVEVADVAMVAGVPGDLELIVNNLLANAVRYNRAGGTVELQLATDSGEQILRVGDTGIGIPSQDLPRVFERFYRVDTDRSHDSGGTGLGLSIVRHAVESHGGSIEVRSVLGEGTTFTVTLPIEPT